MPSWVTATNELSGRGVTPKSDGQTPLGSQNGAVSGEIAPARTVAGYGARLTAAIGNRLTSDAFGTDVLLAVAGLAVTQVRIIQSHDGWPYAPNLFQFLVAVAPALIAIRRTDPVLASLGLAVGAYTSLLLGQTDWVLLVGCASALWSLSSRSRTASTFVVIGIVAIVPLLANQAVGRIAYTFYPETYYEFTDADGSSGSTGKTPPAVLDRVIGMTWPWWVSAVLLLIGLVGLAQLRHRPRSLATAGERFDDVRRVLGEPSRWIAVDALLAVVVASLVLVDIWHGKNVGNWWTAWQWMPYVVGYAPLTLVLRRRYPEIPVLVLAAVSLVTYWQTEERWTLLIGLSIALYSLAVLRSLRIAVNLMVIQAETGPDLAQRDLQEVLAGFQRIGDAGRRALGELDRMLSALRDAEGRPDPALSPQPGLDDIAQLAKGLSEQGLPVKLEVRGSGAPVPDGVQVTAYRLVQEALTNVVKHARATKVQVLVDVSAGGVGVQIIDDGQGFDSTRSADGRHGLTGMRERVRIHEGTFTLRSWPGTGTTVSAFLPYAEEQAIP